MFPLALTLQLLGVLSRHFCPSCCHQPVLQLKVVCEGDISSCHLIFSLVLQVDVP